MRWLISLLIIAVLAIALAMAGRYDPGYVVLVYPPWRMEISFISFVLLLVGLVVGGVVLLRLALLTLNLPSIVRAQRERRAARKRDENFVGGLKAYTEYRYQDAEQSLGQWQGDDARSGVGGVGPCQAGHPGLQFSPAPGPHLGAGDGQTGKRPLQCGPVGGFGQNHLQVEAHGVAGRCQKLGQTFAHIEPGGEQGDAQARGGDHQKRPDRPAEQIADSPRTLGRSRGSRHRRRRGQGFADRDPPGSDQGWGGEHEGQCQGAEDQQP